MGLALIGTMTGPLLVVLHTMPTALFAGVFFVVGVRLLAPPARPELEHLVGLTPLFFPYESGAP